MQHTIQHLYKTHGDDGLLYAWFLSMHTRVDIILCCQKSENELMLVVNSIYDTLRQLERIANYYDPSSELSQVNQRASTAPVMISQSLYRMISLCTEYHKKTLGCFDVTIHSDNYNQDTIHSIHLYPEAQSVFFQQAGTTINLSGFLKGYALDKIREILKVHIIANALINMGNSSVLALGNHPVGTGWKVSFDDQASTTKNHKTQSILLNNECLTTSGNNSDDRKHIISPSSGKPLEGVRQVTVVTDDGTTGEILSTSLFVANQKQRELIMSEFLPKRVIDFGTVPDGLGNGVFTGKGTPKSGIPSASHPIFCNRGLRLSDSPVLPLGTLLA
ncbi:Membrane-associated lipoprotein involved in thiamine biosynthesis [Bacteroides thetaiotaomicron]|nr:Membrane-associated lipoprotein involved in thiamine biosynthesis [Bacteroides thetaiotaomicron]